MGYICDFNFICDLSVIGIITFISCEEAPVDNVSIVIPSLFSVPERYGIIAITPIDPVIVCG